jgi:hypothetical protein
MVNTKISHLYTHTNLSTTGQDTPDKEQGWMFSYTALHFWRQVRKITPNNSYPFMQMTFENLKYIL